MRFVTAILIGVVWAASAQAAFFKTSEASAQMALNQAEALLPQKIKETVGSLEVQFKNLGSEKHAGFTNEKTKKITINSQFLKSATDERRRDNMLLATILHETMHQYDYQAKLSDEVYFNLVSGIEKKSVTFSARTMDAYELKSGVENLAVNFEGFLLDSEFQCRRPTMYAFLKSRLHHIPFTDSSCENQTAKLVKSEGNEIKILELDPARVYQVHYLFASKGKAAMSRWGHAMVRLIVCDAKRATVGPECMADVNSHLSLSFQAIVNGMKLDAMDGIKGEYPSRLNVTSVFTAARQYNMGEQRDVISLPLKMNREQINRLVRRASEYQWSYNGQYKFFTNNCADETLKLLKIGFLSDDIANLKIATPSSLFEKLQQLGKADDMSKKLSEQQLIEQGYLFKSYTAKYSKALAVAQQQIPELQSINKSDDYFKLGAEQRSHFVQKAIHITNENKRTTIAALVLLELGANMTMSSEAQAEALKILLRAEKKHDATRAEELEFFDDVKRRQLDFATALSNTFLMAKGGYGLPMHSEIVMQGTQVSEQERKEIETQGAKVFADLLGEDFSSEYQMQKLNMETLLKNLKGLKPN